jgi:hypothetical protein
LVEQLIRNQQVVRSTRIAGSSFLSNKGSVSVVPATHRDYIIAHGLLNETVAGTGTGALLGSEDDDSRHADRVPIRQRIGQRASAAGGHATMS